MIGTYQGAAKYPIAAPIVRMIANELTMVLPSAQASSSRPCVMYSEKVGTSALTSAPLNTPKRIVGIVAAARNVSISHCVP